MIKWKTTGYGSFNEQAREFKDIGKAHLRGMHCRKCGVDTTIGFIDDGYGYLTYKIDACCQEFKRRIEDKIQPNKHTDLD